MTFNQELNYGQLLTDGQKLDTELFVLCQDILSTNENLFGPVGKAL
jgi:hypothetical protein